MTDQLKVAFEVDTNGAVQAVAKLGSAVSDVASRGNATAAAMDKVSSTAKLLASVKVGLREQFAQGQLSAAGFLIKLMAIGESAKKLTTMQGAMDAVKSATNAAKSAMHGLAAKAKEFTSSSKVMEGLKLGVGIGLAQVGMSGLGDVAHSAMEVYKELHNEARALGAAFGLTGADAMKFASQLKLMKEQSNLTSESIVLGFQQLASAGLKARDAGLVMAGVADVQARLGDAGAESFKKAALGVAKMGVTPEAIGSLKEAGFTLGEMATALKLKGNIKNIQDLNMAVASTKTTSKDALNGLLKMVSVKYDKGGALGGAAAELANGSIEKQLENLKRDIGGIFGKIDLTPVLEGVKNLRASMAGDFGKQLQTSVTQIGTAIIGMVPAIIKVVTVLGSLVASPATKWVLGFVVAMVALVQIVAGATAVAGALSVLGTVITGVGTAMGLTGAIALAVPLAIVAAIAGAAFLIYKYWDNIKAFFASMGPTLKAVMVEIGMFVIDGLTLGMGSKIGGVVEGVKGIANTIGDTFKSVLRIHSPSREMFDQAAFVPQGVALGIESGIGDVETAASGLAGAVKGGANMSGIGEASVAGIGAASGGASGGTAASPANVTINITIDGAGHDANSLGDALEARLQAIAEKLFGNAATLRGSYA